jgi:hypothetical protein
MITNNKMYVSVQLPGITRNDSEMSVKFQTLVESHGYTYDGGGSYLGDPPYREEFAFVPADKAEEFKEVLARAGFDQITVSDVEDDPDEEVENFLSSL